VTGQKKDIGEYILLGIFALFVIAFLIDIHDLPYPAKILTYILTPFIGVLLVYCVVSTVRQPAKPDERKSQVDSGKLDEKAANIRQVKAFGLSAFLFVSIYVLGFYLGSGLMLLVWFWAYKRITLTNMIITVLTPLGLYLIFERLIDFGLYEGLLITRLFD
jgi:hypothetical protein